MIIFVTVKSHTTLIFYPKVSKLPFITDNLFVNFNYYNMDNHNAKYGTEYIQSRGVGVSSM